MKTGDLVRIRRRPRVCAVNKTRDPKCNVSLID
mgnify:CR=1 FL=1